MNNTLMIKHKKAIKNTTKKSITICKKHIESIGGKIWEKHGKSRAYFPFHFDLDLSDLLHTQPYNAYIDLVDGSFNCQVSKIDFLNSNNQQTPRDYWEAYKNYMLSEIKVTRI